MKALARFVVNFTGALAALYGAIVIGANSVALFYLLNGTITAGEENKFLEVVPETLHVAVTLLIGVILLAAGYKGPKYFAAYLEAGKEESGTDSTG